MKTILSRSLPLLLLVAAGGATGCVDGQAEDGIDDSFIGDGKADAFGVAEGSPDALAILQMLRTASLDELDKDAGLSSNAAKAIIHHRQGGDRKDGTADDDAIDSLKELDAIPYVGPMAFQLILDHARATVVLASTDPFDPTFCGQDFALTMAGIRAAFPPGATAGRLPTTTAGVRMRTRTCVTPDNCPDWVNGSQPNLFVSETNPAAANLSIPAAGADTMAGIQIAGDGRPVVVFESMLQVTGSTTTARIDLEAYPAAVPADNDPLQLTGHQLTLDDQPLLPVGTDDGSTTLIGGHCAQMIVRLADNGGATHRQIAFFARY